MSQIPKELKYAKSHEWIREESDNTVTVGVTDHAQRLLGDIVFVDLPETTREVNAGEECGVIESVKAAADVYCPVAGEIIEVNQSLQSAPELLNKDPYGEGWLYRVRLSGSVSAQLMDADNYAKEIAR